MTEAEALDMAAKAAGWLDWKDACHLAERGEIEVIRAHAKTLMENAALEAKLAVARKALERLRDCDWTITLPDRMDGVRDIARAALKEIEGD